MTIKYEMNSANELLEAAWGIIANANEGNWGLATAEWREAAENWRDQYFKFGPVGTPTVTP